MSNFLEHRESDRLLFEMMRTFLVLSDTLNVSQAERKLGITRQTIRRHILNLEKMRGAQLFSMVDNEYTLTNVGKNAVHTAKQILSDAQTWSTGGFTGGPKLTRFTDYEGPEKYTYLEQKGFGDVFSSASPFLRDCMTSWFASNGKLAKMPELRSHSLVFRKDGDEWVLIEVGANSSATKWFGSSWGQSSLGTRVSNLPANKSLAPISNSAFETISETQSARLDHICTLFPQTPGDKLVPTSYKRLILAVNFDDGTPALLNIVQRTHKIEIEGLPDALRLSMDPEYVEEPQLSLGLLDR